MATQLDKLRTQFKSMNITQKKIFITNLREKLQGSNNSEYKKFLNECVNNYNMAIRGSSSVASDTTVSVPGSNNVARSDSFDDDTYFDLNIAKPADRLLAYIIDYLIAIPLFLIAGVQLVFIGLAESNNSYYSYYSGGYIGGDSSLRSLFLILTLVCALLQVIYAIIMLVVQIKNWKKGTSFGKKRMKLYVVNKETGKTISFGYMFLRETFGKYISGMVFYLGFIWILLDKDKQAWHDKLVSSVVVKK